MRQVVLALDLMETWNGLLGDSNIRLSASASSEALSVTTSVSLAHLRILVKEASYGLR